MIIDGQMSDWVQVTSGVPQGSILGPLLFLICMNDIGSDISSSRRLLTDDCTIYREVRNTVNAELLQQDLYKLYHWTQTWQLKLNLTSVRSCRSPTRGITSHSVTFLTTLSLSGSTLSNSSGSNSLANYLGQLRHLKLKPKQHVCLNY